MSRTTDCTIIKVIGREDELPDLPLLSCLGKVDMDVGDAIWELLCSDTNMKFIAASQL